MTAPIFTDDLAADVADAQEVMDFALLDLLSTDVFDLPRDEARIVIADRERAYDEAVAVWRAASDKLAQVAS